MPKKQLHLARIVIFRVYNLSAIGITYTSAELFPKDCGSAVIPFLGFRGLPPNLFNLRRYLIKDVFNLIGQLALIENIARLVILTELMHCFVRGFYVP